MTKLVFDRTFKMSVPAAESTDAKGISQTTVNVLMFGGSLVAIGALALVSPWLALPVMAVVMAIVL